MTSKEMRLAAYFLDWFAEDRGRAGSNDMPRQAAEAASFDWMESHVFARQVLEGRQGTSEADLASAQFDRLQDFEAMHLLAVKLRAAAEWETAHPPFPMVLE